jgi:hypothetical protein
MAQDKPVQIVSSPDPTNFGAIQVNPNKTVRRTVARPATKSETSLQALKRMFGDVVFDIIPTEVREAIDVAYKFYLENPDAYLVTEFDTGKSRDDALAVMRAYAEIANPAGYTIRTLKDAADFELHWRVQSRIKHAPAE